MFKKPGDVAERNKTLLRKKEIQILKSDVLQKFNIEEEKLSTILNSKTHVEMAKLMNKVLLYYFDGVPYFFDEGNKGVNGIFPTLQFLWKFPNAIRTFLIHSQVSHFVLNGADLMLPGVAVRENLTGIEVGEICSIRVLGNPLPFAIGRSLCSWEGILANNMRGRGLSTVACFGDLLSGLGMGFTATGPNEGFKCNAPYIYRLEGWEEAKKFELDIEDNDEEEEEGEEDTAGVNSEDKVAPDDGDGEGEGEGAAASHAERTNARVSGAVAAEGDSCDRPVEGGVEDINAGDHPGALRSRGQPADWSEGSEGEDGEAEAALDSVFEGAGEELEAGLGGDESDSEAAGACMEKLAVAVPSSRRLEPTAEQRLFMNSRLKIAFALLLKHVVKDKAFPVLVNVVWPALTRVGNFLYNTTNPGIVLSGIAEAERGALDTDVFAAGRGEDDPAVFVLEVKRSQFRSASAFVQWAEAEGIITLLEGEVAGTALSIAAVNRTHDIFRAIRLANPDALKKFLETDDGQTAAQSLGANSKLELVIKELYKIPRNIRDVLQGLTSSHEHRLDEYVTTSELKDLLADHIRENGLDSSTDRSCLTIPPENPLWSMGASVLKATTTTTQGQGATAGEGKSAATSTARSAGSALPTEKSDHDPRGIFTSAHSAYEDDYYDDDYEADCRYGEAGLDLKSVGGGRVIAGVWMPTTTTAPTVVASSFAGGAASSSQWKASPNARPVSLSSASAATHAKKLPEGAASKAPSGEQAELLRAARKERNAANKLKSDPAAQGAVTVKKEALMRYIVSKLTKGHSIQQYPGAVPVFSTGPTPSVEISVEQRQARKYMTHINGLEAFGVDLPALAKDIQKKFASAASFGPSTDNPKKKEVYVQGNLAQQTLNYLCSDCGFQAKWINITLKKGVKAAAKAKA